MNFVLRNRFSQIKQMSLNYKAILAMINFLMQWKNG